MPRPNDLSSEVPFEVEVSEELLVLQQAPPLFWLGGLILSLLLALFPDFGEPFLAFLHSAWRERQTFETFWEISMAANPAMRCWYIIKIAFSQYKTEYYLSPQIII